MSYFKHDKALVHEDAHIEEGTRIWAFAHVQAGARIGRNCNICDNSFIEKGAIVGNNVTIKHNVSIFNGVTIEDEVFVGSNIAFINDRYPHSQRKDWVLEKTLVKKGATLGSNSVIMCGVTIGSYAVVGAGSVVLKDVPAHQIYVGNPALFKGYAGRCGQPLDENFKCRCGMEQFSQEEIEGIK